MPVYRSPDTITLDVHAQSIKTPVFFVTGDVNAYPLLFKIVDGGVNKYDLTDKIVAIVCKVPNSTTPIVDNLVITDPTEGSCSYTVKNSIYANAGEIQAEIHIFDSEQNRLSTCTFYMTVRQGIDDSNGIEASDNYPILVQLIAQVQGNKTGKLQYTIACSDSVNKDRADLVLTGAVDENGGSIDVTAINAALAELDTARGSDKTIPIRVDFIGGHINNINTSIVIPENFNVYGNGTVLTAKRAGVGYDGSQSELAPFTGLILLTIKANIDGLAINMSYDSYMYNDSIGMFLNEGNVSNCTIGSINEESDGIGTYMGIYVATGVVSNCSAGNIGSGVVGIKVDIGNISDCTIESINAFGIGICGGGTASVFNCTIGSVNNGVGISVSTGEAYHCTVGNIGSGTGISVHIGSVFNCNIGSINNGGTGILVDAGYNHNICNNKVSSMPMVGAGATGISVAGINCLVTNNNIGEKATGNTTIQLYGTGTVKKSNIENNIYVA
jgi:hypothetical protein